MTRELEALHLPDPAQPPFALQDDANVPAAVIGLIQFLWGDAGNGTVLPEDPESREPQRQESAQGNDMRPKDIHKPENPCGIEQLGMALKNYRY